MLRQVSAEALGTALLLISVVGSGIMAETLSQDLTGLALLANAIATGCMLFVIITVLGPISGAHFNPAVTLAFTLRGDLTLALASAYIGAQIVGGVIGVWAAHAMFDLPIFQLATTERTGTGQWISEAIATFGLLFVIFGGIFARRDAIPTLVALYITGAYWFTASTSFANPAVTLARSLSDTFAGIALTDVAAFIAAQIITVFVAHVIFSRLFTEA